MVNEGAAIVNLVAMGEPGPGFDSALDDQRIQHHFIKQLSGGAPDVVLPAKAIEEAKTMLAAIRNDPLKFFGDIAEKTCYDSIPAMLALLRYLDDNRVERDSLSRKVINIFPLPVAKKLPPVHKKKKLLVYIWLRIKN